MKKNSRSYIGPFVAFTFLIACVLGGCQQHYDSNLVLIDAKMEAHPDSALMLLNDYRLTSATSTADSAYYGLLLTHARYKNFIDETDDSLISKAVDFFVRKDDKERAARALFLQGMIQMNANRLGDAAVSFTRGLDIAREGNCYMWEGQCARGLCMMYGKLYDGSAQIAYAEIASEALLKTGLKNWISNSIFETAMAYHNSCKYEECLSLLSELMENYGSEMDTLKRAHVFRLRGLSLVFLDRYEESLQSYGEAYRLNMSVLTDNDWKLIKTAFRETGHESILKNDSIYRQLSLIESSSADEDIVLAERGNYKKAYESLVQYKNMQDSVLSLIFRNNVSESIAQYEEGKQNKQLERERFQRVSYIIVILVLLLVGISVAWWLRERMLKEKGLRLVAEADLESMRCDLKTRLKSVEALKEENLSHLKDTEYEAYEQIIRKQYAETNRLIDEYYQRESISKDSVDVKKEIIKLTDSFKSGESLENIIRYVDEQSGGLFSSFKTDFFELTNESHLIFLYLMLGFGARTISVIIGQNINVVYNKKSRLKAKIQKSSLPESERYLRFF